MDEFDGVHSHSSYLLMDFRVRLMKILWVNDSALEFNEGQRSKEMNRRSHRLRNYVREKRYTGILLWMRSTDLKTFTRVRTCNTFHFAIHFRIILYSCELWSMMRYPVGIYQPILFFLLSVRWLLVSSKKLSDSFFCLALPLVQNSGGFDKFCIVPLERL